MKNPTYPLNEPFLTENGICRPIYKSAAAAILDQNQICFIEACLEQIMFTTSSEQYEEIDPWLDGIFDVIKQGKAKMNSLHTFLGAFDAEDVIGLTKPIDQKIKWEEESSQSQ